MGRFRLKKMHKGDKPMKEKYRTKHRTKDLDEIHEDMKEPVKHVNQGIDLDKPGSGQFYCLHCAKYFISERAIQDHFKAKTHKRRLKALEMEPYTQAEADRAAGMGSYIAPKKNKVVTQDKKITDGDAVMEPS